MGDLRVDRLARVLVERMLMLRRGQTLLVDAPALAEPLVERVVHRAHDAGATVSARIAVDGLARAILTRSTVAALAQPDEPFRHAMATVDAYLRILGEWNTADLADVPGASRAAALRSTQPGQETRFARAAAGDLRWAVTVFPTPADAQAAGLPLRAWEDVVYGAARVDEDDPVGAWRLQERAQERLRTRLEDGRTLRFQGEGTDLTLSVAGRRWRSSAARRNLPDGEVFSGPVEDSAEGHVRFSYPVSRRGARIEDIRLTFRRGLVVGATAAVGEAALHELLDVDAGARRLGEVGIGTNFRLGRFTGHTLLDEKIGGTFHLALGRGYPETGSTNVSAEHWDLICDLRRGGEILLDGRAIQAEGRFLPEVASL